MNLNLKKVQVKNITNSLLFESFLKRARLFDKSLKEPKKQHFINLINSENGSSIIKQPETEIQLNEIKNDLSNAINVFISKSENNEQKKILVDLLEKIKIIKTSSHITELINYSLEITENFK